MPIQRAYTDGTVRLTAGSAVVRGTGTAWALRLVNGGLFTFGGRAFPIASVASDTELTLENPSTVTYEGIYAIDMHSAEAATTLAASRRLADILAGLNGMSSLGRQLTAAETADAMRTVLDALGRDGLRAMKSLLRLAPSTADNGSLLIPAGSATPAGAALADGVVWGDGSNILWRPGGTTRVARDSRPGSIPNANLTDMQPGTVKMRRPGTLAGPPVDVTIAQLIANLGGPVPLPTFTAAGGETQAIFTILAGVRGVSFEGSFAGSDAQNTRLSARLSFDGGATYLSADNSYQFQHRAWSGTSGSTFETASNSMPFAEPPGAASLMTQFAIDLDFFPNRHGRFSVRGAAADSSTANRITQNDGYFRANGTPTHILIFQQGGTMLAGTQIRAEAR